MFEPVIISATAVESTIVPAGEEGAVKGTGEAPEPSPVAAELVFAPTNAVELTVPQIPRSKRATCSPRHVSYFEVLVLFSFFFFFARTDNKRVVTSLMDILLFCRSMTGLFRHIYVSPALM